MRIKHIANEEAAGVGKITKQNTTVDVKPGETARQAAKFGNKVDKNGKPPELHKKARKNSNAHILTNLGLAEEHKLNELFDQAHSWHWFDKGHRRWAATFKAAHGKNIYVYFLPKSYNSPNWIVNFDLEGSHRRSNEGDHFQIFRTVIDIIGAFMQNNEQPVESIEFSAHKESGYHKDEKEGIGKRAKLYTRMVKRFAQHYGYEFAYEDDGHGETMFLVRNPKNSLDEHIQRVREVQIDNVKGRGAVPNNQEVDYFGLRTKMRPSMFLKLAAPLAGGPKDEMVNYIKQGGAIGAPFLIVDVPEDLNQDIPHIVGHEGRNRMKAIMKAEGDDPIEVHLFFRGAVDRARHLTKEIVNLLKAGAYQERTGRHVPGPLWEGKYPVAPHDEWYGDRQYQEQGAQMKMMSPDQYLSRVRPLQLDDESEENIEDLMNHIRSGRTLDPLKIYPDGKEDGRHRAYAAKRLGIKRVPVIIWPQKEITEAEQRIPVSQNYNQDRGNLDWIVIQIEKTIKELGDNLDVLVKTVNWDQLYATQDWLDNHGGGDPVFPDIPEDFWGYPVIASTGREFLIIDGHHRLNRDLANGEEAEGLIFDVRSSTKESEIRKPHPSQTLGIKRKHMPQVHRDHYPELIDYLADHGNRFTHGEVHAHELKATQGEFSDKGVRKMMKTGGRPSDSMGKDKKPLIVSSDNYIIDGHHRWLAAWNQDDVVPIMKSSLPIKQLFQLIKDFRHTTYKDIHESQRIKEALKDAYPYQMTRNHTEVMAMVAKAEDGTKIKAMLGMVDNYTLAKLAHYTDFDASANNLDEDDVWEFFFKRDGDADATGQGDQFRIFATVVNIFRDMAKRKKPNVILFSATKVEDSGGPRRAKLYDRFAKKFADESGYKVSRLETPDESYFMLTAPGLKLVEGLSLMDRACLEGGHNLEDLAESRIMGVPIDRNYMPDEFDDVEISRKKLIGKINDKFNLWFGKSKYPQKDGEYLLIVEDENKNRIGMAMLYLAKNDIPEYDMKNLYSVALVYVDSSYANQNIGLEMYAAAINSGISLLSDYQQTLGGQKLWKRLSQYPGVEVYATAIYSDYDTDESRVVISDIDYDEFGNIDSSFFVYDDDYTDEEIKLHNQLSQAQKMLKSLKSKGGKKSADRQDQIVTLEREIQAIMDELNTFNDEDESYSDVRLMATRSNSIKENMSITGTERQRSERDKKLTPGSEAWFRHWFSRPYLRREQVEQLKQEAVNHIKGARHEKATNRRRSDRNIRTNERRGTRRC